MNLKKLMFLALIDYAILSGSSVLAQHNELSFQLTPHWLSSLKLDETSQIAQGKDQFAGLGGLSYAHFTSSGLGLRAGFNLGYFRPKLIVNRNPGNGLSDQLLGSVVMYNSLSIEPVYRFKWLRSEFEFFGGADLRYFHSNGYSSYGYHYQSTIPSEFSTFEISVAPYQTKYQSNFYGGISYIKSINTKSRIGISLITNFGLSKPGGGQFTATADNGNTFQTNFKPVTDFTGIRIQYGYNVRKNEKPIESSDGLIRHAIFLEALGSGGLFSLNYDRRLKSGNDGLGVRVGLGIGTAYESNQDEFKSRVSVPLMVNYIFGRGRSGLETGIGITPEYAVNKPQDDQRMNAWGNLNVLYRLQPVKKGFIMRVGWTPVIGGGGTLDPYFAGVSFGYSFKK
ncbi:hypothetical protein [Daejeonella sp.]|uniref:hypothetical protein n=1 Tax=Daejeonella sp. TaxID=2805397 RepID=UPI002730FE1E|nr:hypothetical protein [Daejeonella sp.]MDP2414074.1 hypothetical protein [Daejeonella sp.]